MKRLAPLAAAAALLLAPAGLADENPPVTCPWPDCPIYRVAKPRVIVQEARWRSLRERIRAHVAPPATVLSFTTFASGFAREPFLGSSTPRNRIYLARARKQALRWDKWLLPTPGSPVARDNDFGDQALVGVFLLGRHEAAKVTVTNLRLRGETLELSIEIVPFPRLVCVPRPGWGCISPMISMPPGRAYTLAAVSQAAIANVRRVVVTDEVDDAPAVMNVG